MSKFSSTPFPDNFRAGDKVWENLAFSGSMTTSPPDIAAEAEVAAKAIMGQIEKILAQDQEPVRMESKSTHSSRPVMSEITREELDAKMVAIEAKIDARLERFDKDMRQAVGDFRLEVQPLKSLKTNIWSATGIIVGTVVATAVSVAALSFGAFDSGRETSQLVEQAKQQSADNRKLLEQLDSKLRSIPSQPSPQGTERSEKAPAP